MDLENSLITTWKDTQVLRMCLPASTTSRTLGWWESLEVGDTPSCPPWVSAVPQQKFGEGPSPTLVSPLPIILRLLPRRAAAPAPWDTITSPWGEGMFTAPMPAWHQCHPLFPQLSQAGDLIIEVYLEQKLPDCCVTLKVSPKGGPC